jgi:uncharacterized Ntn-hydrolase superfamily protein
MKRYLRHSILLLLFIGTLQAQHTNSAKEAFAHTFSIVARDSITGEMAVGVQSHWFSVGTSVPWGKSGVGVVATQSFVNPAYGPNGLQLMQDGMSAKDALNKLTKEDEGRDYRQVAFLASSGKPNAYTGAKCVEYAGQIVDENFSVQANMMLNDKVVPAMAEAFRKNNDLPIAERVVAVLKAAQQAGGDIRGRQSAALIVVGAELAENPWEEHTIDLRVDDNDNPVKELERLLKTARAYQYMNRGDLAVEANDMQKALAEYGAAESLFPDNLEMSFWKAVSLANSGEMQEAKPIFKRIFAEDENWRLMIKRLVKPGLLTATPAQVEEITKL